MPYRLEPRGTSCRSCSASGGGSTGPSTSPRCGLGAASAGSTRCSPGPRPSSTTTRRRISSTARSTSSPRRSAELGLRSVLCYEVTDRDGAARAAAGVAENRRFLARPRPLARGMVGAHASFTLGDDTLAACAEAAAAPGVGVHIHVAEDGADERDAEAAYGLRVVERLAGPGVLSPERSSPTASTSTEQEVADSSQRRGGGRAQPAQQHEQPRRPLTARRAPGRGSRSAPTGSAGTCSRSPRLASSGPQRRTPRRPGWPLRRSPRAPASPGAVFGEPLLGTLEPGRPGRPRRPRLPVPDAARPARTSPATGSSASSSGQVRDVIVAGELVVADRRSTRVDQSRARAAGRGEAERLWAAARRDPAAPVYAPKAR